MGINISNYCFVCGAIDQQWQMNSTITDDLAQSWQLTKLQRQQLDRRESSFCPKCGNSLLNRSLAQAIVNQIQLPKVYSLIEWIKRANRKGIRVAEINSCGKLHLSLRKISRLYYSEFNLDRNKLSFWQKLRTPRHEDITKLSYHDNTFDLVLHSEVLEHVCDSHQALLECRRILKPNGICLFTTPLIPKRKTKKCVDQNPENKEIIYQKNPSFHSGDNKKNNLVWWEFGGDFIKKERVKTVISNTKNLTCVYAIIKKAETVR